MRRQTDPNRKSRKLSAAVRNVWQLHLLCPYILLCGDQSVIRLYRDLYSIFILFKNQRLLIPQTVLDANSTVPAKCGLIWLYGPNISLYDNINTVAHVQISLWVSCMCITLHRVASSAASWVLACSSQSATLPKYSFKMNFASLWLQLIHECCLLWKHPHALITLCILQAPGGVTSSPRR